MLAIVCVAVICVSMLAACDNKEPTATDDSTYTIQYTDESGTYKVEVKNGEAFTFNKVPSKTGYEFVGLFDAKVGGTQYTDNFGASLSAYTDKKNLVLFPQFNAKEYTVVLDYQGAEVTSGRQFTVAYNSKITELPKNLVLENKTFVGWYTKPNCEGVKVADAYGVLPKISDINEKNFDLSEGYIYLYAGFEGEKHTVTLFFEDSNGNVDSEEIKVEHGTLVSKIVVKARVDGKAPIAWSKSENGEIFNGKITGETVLYAREYAPVIDFDSNGGKDVTSLVARAGAGITLPTPQRENYVFDGWYTQGGVAVNYTTMPSDGQTLVAKWKAMIVFDERGGTEVDDISEKVGERVTLPTTSKDGYIFAGWYTEQGEAYTSTSMPSDSIKLVAKYYKVQTKKQVLIKDGIARGGCGALTAPTPLNSDFSFKLDIEDLFNSGVKSLTMTAHYRVAYDNTIAYKAHFAVYNSSTASEAYKLWQHDDSFDNNDWKSITVTKQNIQLSSSTAYLCLWCDSASASWSGHGAKWTDFWLEIEYPDTSQLF